MAFQESDLENHIATLERFETLYGEFLVERHSGDHHWPGAEWASRERELKLLAPQAEAAFVAAGARSRWDGGPVRHELAARILRFVDEGDGIDDADQWRIHGELVTHIGNLEGKLQNTSGRDDPKRLEKVNGNLIGLLALIAVVGTLLAVVVKGAAAWVVVTVTVLLIIPTLFFPPVRRPVSRWLDRNLG